MVSALYRILYKPFINGKEEAKETNMKHTINSGADATYGWESWVLTDRSMWNESAAEDWMDRIKTETIRNSSKVY